MIFTRQTETNWTDSGLPGIQVSTVWESKEGDGCYFSRFAANARFQKHSHHGGWEQIYVLEGRIRFGEVDMRAGDTLHMQGIDEHDALALEDTIIFVTQHGLG